MAGGLNVANQFQADVQQYIADETLPVARRQLVAYQAGEPLTLPKGMGTTYTATRFQRLPLPQYPLAEGVPPPADTAAAAGAGSGSRCRWCPCPSAGSAARPLGRP